MIRHMHRYVAALMMVVLAFASAWPRIVSAQQVDQRFWFTNGAVDAIAREGDVVYIGGYFTGLRCWSGSASPVDRVSGAPLDCMRVGGVVHAVTADGQGGWYLGGEFSTVQGVPRANLAHVDGDFSVTAWNPQADGAIHEIVVAGPVVYVAGNFTTVGGVLGPYVQALDAETGLSTGWIPNPDDQVRAIGVSGSVVYLGGFFNQIGGQTRNYLAAVDASSGLALPWSPSLAPVGPDWVHVRDLIVDGTTIYIAGQFSHVNGQSRLNLAAVDAVTGAPTAFAPQADQVVEVILKRGSTVYAGGNFRSIGSGGRPYLAALDATTGLATSWRPLVSHRVRAIAEEGGTVYVGGDFWSVYPSDRNYIAAIDAATGVPTSWNPDPSGPVEAIAVDGTTVFAGGAFQRIGVLRRKHLAALDANTGQPTAWAPEASSWVRGIVVSGSTVYVGGDFTSIEGQTRSHLAALDAATGSLLPWNPTLDSGVKDLAWADGRLYAVGSFGEADGSQRRGVAAFEFPGGALAPFDPITSAVSTPEDVDIVGSNAYLAGTFFEVDGVGYERVARVDADDGSVDSWYHGPPNASVYAIEASGSTVYFGGSFTYVGGLVRSRLAAANATNGTLTSWNPGIGLEGSQAFVRDIFVRNGVVYIGGNFATVGSDSRRHLAAIDPFSGAALPWNPDVDGHVFALAGGPSVLYVGGGFSTVGGLYRQGFAAVTIPEDLTGVPGSPPPQELSIARVLPNPARDRAVIEYRLTGAAEVEIGVFDVQGREVARLERGVREAGLHRATWDGRHAKGDLATPGVYYARCRANGKSHSARFVVAR